MSLVAYSDSEDGTDESSKDLESKASERTTQATAPKRKRSSQDEAQRSPRPSPSAPPPLPPGFATLYASTVRSSTSDDPTLHSGRKRQIPHVEGNWPSFVYLEWLPSPQDLASLEDVIANIAAEHAEINGSSSPGSTANGEVRSSLRSELGVRLPLHVSLSTPLILTTTNKDTFADSLEQTINLSSVSSFVTNPSSIKWVKNFDATRHFLILTLSRPKQDELQNLLSVCNSTAATFRLPQLYARKTGTELEDINVGVVSPSSIGTTGTTREYITPNHDRFHISIAWSLTPIHTSQTLTDKLREKLKHITIKFDSVHIKIGSQISSVSLRESAVSSATAVGNAHSNTD